jgi:hypothetical protein
VGGDCYLALERQILSVQHHQAICYASVKMCKKRSGYIYIYIFGVFCSIIIRYEYNFEVSHFVPNDLKFTTFSNDLTGFFFGTKGQALFGELTNKSSSQPIN